MRLNLKYICIPSSSSVRKLLLLPAVVILHIKKFNVTHDIATRVLHIFSRFSREKISQKRVKHNNSTDLSCDKKGFSISKNIAPVVLVHFTMSLDIVSLPSLPLPRTSFKPHFPSFPPLAHCLHASLAHSILTDATLPLHTSFVHTFPPLLSEAKPLGLLPRLQISAFRR